MRLEPGPIPTITSDWLQADVEQPGFTDLFTTVDFEMDLLLSQLDQWQDPLGVIDGALADDGILSAVDIAAADTVNTAVLVDLAQIPPMDDQWTDSTAAIINAYQQTPGEAFTPVPAADDYGGSAPPPIVPGNATVGLYNISRRGATDFVEGENYQVNINISTDGQVLDQYYKVTVTWWPESGTGTLGQSTLGVTDLNGQAAFYGTWPAGSAGTWDAVVLGTAQSGAVGDLAHLYWTISPAAQPETPAAAAGPAIAIPVNVTFSSPGRGVNPHLLLVGDGWTLSVTGPPNSPVVIGGQHNGQTLQPLTLGKTGPDGLYTLNGQSQTGDVGDWLETYTVGGVAWNGALNFSVQ